MAKAAAKVPRFIESLTVKVPQLAKCAVDVSKPRLNTFWRYAKVELRPPTLAELPQVQKTFSDLIVAGKTQKWKNLTVKEAWLNTLVAVEVACWFFVGEAIGKRNLVGYKVEGAYDYSVHF